MIIIPRLPNRRQSWFLAIAVAAIFVVAFLVVRLLSERPDLLETEPWQEFTANMELRSELMGDDPVKHDQAKKAFEFRAAQGDLIAQEILDLYWTLSDEPEKYERGTQWSLIVLSCVSGADIMQRGSMSRESVLLSMSGLTVWTTRDKIQTGIEMAREWFANNREGGHLDYCNVSEIDEYEASLE